MKKMSAVPLQWTVCSLVCLVLFGSAMCASSQGAADHDRSNSKASNEKFRILGLFGHPGKSHFDVFRPLLEELGRRGHEVTVISFFPRDNKTEHLPNYRDISLVRQASDVFVDAVDLNTIRHALTRLGNEVRMLRNWALVSCETCLSNPKIQEFIKSDSKFDLIITESFNSDCLLGFVHLFKVPFVSLSSHELMPWVQQRLANDDNPSYVPMLFLSFEKTMTFFQRVINTVANSMVKFHYEIETNRPMQAIIEKYFGPGVPPLREIARNTSLVLVNTHFSLHGSKPNLPSIIEVGGIHISPNVQPLPADIKRFLDEAHEGVLYFSLGSVIKSSTMPKDKLEGIMKMIRSIPRKVLWKWEADMPDMPANLMVKKWMPQSAILRHPNVKCYLAHGGLLGMSEGVYAGVPMVIIPMFGDQFLNAAAAKSRGVAEVLDWSDLSENTIRTALDRIFNDTRYARNAKALSRAYLDRPKSPLETAVWWTEYIARGNGNSYLKSAAQDLTWYQYYLLDVILFIIAVALLAAYVSFRIALLFLAAICRRGKDLSGKGTNATASSRKKKN